MKCSYNLRRVTGGILLSAALVMLVMGRTFLWNRFTQIGFLVYWSVVFLLTCLAALMALIDLTIVRRRSRREQRELLRATLEQAETELKNTDENK